MVRTLTAGDPVLQQTVADGEQATIGPVRNFSRPSVLEDVFRAPDET
jgi:hypothetical protein